MRWSYRDAIRRLGHRCACRSATDFGRVNHVSPLLGRSCNPVPGIVTPSNMVLNNRYVELISRVRTMAIPGGVNLSGQQPAAPERIWRGHSAGMIRRTQLFPRKYGRPERIDDLNEHKLAATTSKTQCQMPTSEGSPRPRGDSGRLRTGGWLTVERRAIRWLNAAHRPGSGIGLSAQFSVLRRSDAWRGLWRTF